MRAASVFGLLGLLLEAGCLRAGYEHGAAPLEGGVAHQEGPSGEASRPDAALPCATASPLLFCDDFEGAPESWQARLSAGGGTATASSTVVRHGKGALRLEAAVGQVAGMTYPFAPALQSGPLHVRAFFNLDKAFAVSGWMLLIRFNAGALGKLSTDLDAGDEIALVDNANGFGQVAWEEGKQGVIGRERWICVEMGVSLGAAGTMDLWVNDQHVAGTEAPVNTLAAGGYESISVGIADLYLSTPVVLWIDDVALSTQRIGCGG